jgi:signal peptidase I
MKKPTLRRCGAITGLALGGLLLLAAIALWPVQLGGSTAFVTTHGISMEPRFHTGDLAILRASDTYNVGDITGYHSSTLHRVVMHRIVKIQNGLYTFKGDNNSWLDPAPAEKSQLIGKLALRVPHGGIVLAMTQRAAPYLVVALMLIAGGGTAAVQRRGRRKRGTMSRHAAARGPNSGSLKTMPPQLVTAAGITAVAVALGMGLLALAATAPVVTSQAKTAQSQQMVFSYSAPVGQTAAYDTTTASSPDPIFRKLSNFVDLHLAYSGAPGTMAIAVEESNGLGWHSTWQLAPASPVSGRREVQTVRLDLAQFDAKARAAALATGLPTGNVALAIQPRVTTSAGAVFSPSLALTLSPLELNLSGQATSLVETAPAQVVAQATRNRVISIFGHRLAATTARSWSWLILGASLLSALVIWLLVRLDGNPSEGDSIRRRYSSLLVRVEPITASPNRPIVDVEEMGTLVKLAERYGLLILHWSRSGVATFVVQDENTTYRYRAGAADTEAMTRRYRRGSAKRSADPGAAEPLDGYEVVPFEDDTALSSDGSPG